jgi:hypothetical protein
MLNGRWLRNRLSSWPLFWPLLTILVICGVYGWTYARSERQISTGLGDFATYHAAAVALREGGDPYTSGTNAYIYPPLLAFLLQPLAGMEFSAACRVFIFVNMAVSLCGLALAARECVRRLELRTTLHAEWMFALASMVLMFDKVRTEVRMGQTNAIMLLMFVLGLRWLDTRPVLSGLALGFAFNIKYLSIALVPYLLIRRRWMAAAAFAGGAMLFAFLPALSTGWSRNLHHLGVAMGGMGRTVGRAPEGEVANVPLLAHTVSVSVPSAFARLVGPEREHGLGLALAGASAAVVLGLALWMYRRWRVPIIAWPDAAGQRSAPFLTLVLLEWIGIIAFLLGFSPQTNMRHTYMELLPAMPVVGMLLVPRAGVDRRWLAAAAIVITAGLNLPPGGKQFMDALNAWRGIGGPSWCVLIGHAMVLWAVLPSCRVERNEARA